MPVDQLQLRHFGAILDGTGIEVRASSVPGTDMRGLFVRESEAADTLLYTEVPLACWLSPALLEMQEFWIRYATIERAGNVGGMEVTGRGKGETLPNPIPPRMAPEKALAPPSSKGAPVARKTPPASLRCCHCLAAIAPGEAVLCDKLSTHADMQRRTCLEVYCSPSCRENASILHHAMICPDALAAEGATKQLEALDGLRSLSDPSLPFTPMVVLQVMAGLFSRALAALLQTEDETLSLEYAFSPYARFFGSSQVCVENYPMDEAYTWTRSFFDDVAGCYARAAPTITFGDHDFSLTRQTFLAPEFYSFIVSVLCFNSLAVSIPLTTRVGTPAEAVARQQGQEGPKTVVEDVVGAALFQCLSNINHSCEPNCQIDFLGGTSEGTLRLLRDVQAGDELFITYVCPDEPLAARRERLAPYQFVCNCPKCLREGRGREEEHGGDSEPS